VVSTVLTFIIYYQAMERLSATSLSLVAYLIPVVGLGLGVLFLGERPGWPAYLGCALVIAGMMVGNGLLQPRVPGPSRHPVSTKQFAIFKRTAR
jgi:drug/metabolite transporter (DMT)-like permease